MKFLEIYSSPRESDGLSVLLMKIPVMDNYAFINLNPGPVRCEVVIETKPAEIA